jgi:hypothetical protein
MKRILQQIEFFGASFSIRPGNGADILVGELRRIHDPAIVVTGSRCEQVIEEIERRLALEETQ